MTLLQHQRLAGIVLSTFALVEFGVLINTVFEVRRQYLDVQDADISKLILFLMILGLVFALALIVTQFSGGVKMALAPARPTHAWGVTASIIAIMTLWGLPAGIYGIWTQISLNKAK